MTGHLITRTRVVGDTYGAAELCIDRAAAAGMDVEGAVAREDNEVGAIFSGKVAGISCDDCLRSLCGLRGALVEAGARMNCLTALGGERS